MKYQKGETSQGRSKFLTWDRYIHCTVELCLVLDEYGCEKKKNKEKQLLKVKNVLKI